MKFSNYVVLAGVYSTKLFSKYKGYINGHSTYPILPFRYYRDIKTMAAISDQDMNAMLAEESRVRFLSNVPLP